MGDDIYMNKFEVASKSQKRRELKQIKKRILMKN